MSETIGFNDNAGTKDTLGMLSRCKGIAEFMSKCSMPMTLAIQGDWGAGKTTCMQLIEEQLKEMNKPKKLCLIKFNTWQFSVIGDGSKLIYDLLYVMTKELGEAAADFKDKDDDKVSGPLQSLKSAGRKLRFLGTALVNIGKEYLLDTDGGKIFGGVADTAKSYQLGDREGAKTASAEELFDSITQTVFELKARVKEVVDSIIASGEVGDRVYVFIDDLDRLEPRLAVELMECLKNFMDCDGLVFVLAVDREVVDSGLRSKYGEGFDKVKARKFFDKLIQVPFSLPVGSYSLSSYLESGFVKDTNKVGEYISLLECFKVKNPRTIKRTFNALQLNECIVKQTPDTGESGELSPDKRLRLYSLLLLQMELPEEYKWLLTLAEEYRDQVKNGNADGFVAKLKQLLDPSVHPELEQLRSECIICVIDLFWKLSEDQPPAPETVKELTELVVRSNETASVTIDVPLKRIRTMRELYHTLQGNQSIVFSDDWELLEDDSSSSRSSLTLSASVGGTERVKLNWYGGNKLLNLTLYSELGEEQMLAGAEEHFVRAGIRSDDQESKYSYYFALNSSGSRITLSNFEHYKPGCPIDKLLKNCGLI